MNAFYSNQNDRVILSDDDVKGIQDIYGMLFLFLPTLPYRTSHQKEKKKDVSTSIKLQLVSEVVVLLDVAIF